MRQLLTVLCVLLASVADASEHSFTFAPSDGLECIQHVTRTVVTDIGNVAPRREEKTVSVTGLQYEKHADGYRMRGTTESIEVTRDGQRIDDPLTQIAIGRELVFEIDLDGLMTGASGFDTIVADMKAALPPESRAALASLTPESLINREIAEWNGRIAAFLGKPIQEGEEWEGEEEYALPTGPMKFSSLTRISKVEQRDGSPIATINFAYAADGQAAKKLMEQVQDGLAEMGQMPDMKIDQPVIRGGGERVIDGSTMNIEREKITRVISAPVQMKNGPQITMVRTETKEYRFECRE